MTAVFLAQEGGGGSGFTSIIFLALMVGVFYLLIIRPQRKRSAAQKELASSLEIGQEIRTIGGIHGTISSVDDDSIVIKVEDGQLRISKKAIGARVGDAE